MTNQAKIVVSAEDRASRVLQQVRSQLATTSASAAELAASAGLIGPAFATLASAAGLVGFVKSVADAVDALNDVADATGASIENLSGLERVARLNGGTLDDVSGILLRFNKALTDARDPGSAAAQTFGALGLSVRALQALDPAEALQRTAVALAGFADDGNKARVMQELLGKSIKDAAPFLKDLADAGQLNGKVTREQAEQAERFNKVLAALRVSAQDASRSLIGDMAVALESTIKKAQSAITVFGGLGGALGAVLGGATQFKDAPAEGLREYNRQIAELDERIRKVRDGSDGFRGRAADQRVEGLQKERAELAKVADYYRTLLNMGSAGQGRGGVGSALPGLTLPDARGRGGAAGAAVAQRAEVDQAAEGLFRYIQQLGRESEAVGLLTEQQRALNLLRYAGATGELPQLRALTLELARQADARREDAFFSEVLRKANEREAQSLKALDDALDSYSGRAQEASRQALLARLEARRAAGEVFTDEELQKTLRTLSGAGPAVVTMLDDAGRSLERFGRTVEGALGDSLESALRGNFSSIGRMWSDMLLKMAADALAADLSSALFGNLFKAPGAGVAGGGMGLLGDLIGSVFSLGPGRAGGGTVNPMSLQPVNERGFELFRSGGQDWLLAGPQGGKVVPADQVGRGMTVVVNNALTVGAGVSRNEVAAALAMSERRTVAAVYDAARRGVAVPAA